LKAETLAEGIDVILLSYNEADNLKILLPQIKQETEKCEEPFEILVVDTAKPTDNTSEVCKEFGARYINQDEPAFGGAFRTAIRYANRSKFLIMDSDGSHQPKYIPIINKKFNEDKCDVVIGSRYCKGGVSNDAPTSQIMSHMLNWAYRHCIGIKARDLSTDYRMYRTVDLKKVHLECENYDVLEEVLLKLKLNKPHHTLKVEEIPIVFQKRVYGESKRQLGKFIRSYIATLFKLLRLRVSFKDEES
jgi:dolichol-phosphate mannosyltransferase